MFVKVGYLDCLVGYSYKGQIIMPPSLGATLHVSPRPSICLSDHPVPPIFWK